MQNPFNALEADLKALLAKYGMEEHQDVAYVLDAVKTKLLTAGAAVAAETKVVVSTAKALAKMV